MDKWQRSYGGRALFICVCVEGAATARSFSRSYLRNAMNCVLCSAIKFPAQLGCSGLAILDAKGCFVTTCSASFLQLRERAFRSVEQQLALLLQHAQQPARGGQVEPAPPPPPLPPAAAVSYVIGAALPLVGHAEMDAEHAAIVEALDTLARSRSVDSLRVARDEFAEHAEHEETLMASVGFGAAGGMLSAARSHALDHARIVDLADTIIAQTSSSRGGLVAPRDIANFATAVHAHAAAFDVLYVDAIAGGAEPTANACGTGS